MKKLIIAITLFAFAVPAHAEVVPYGCHRPDDFRLYSLKVDTAKKTINWIGIVYNNLKTAKSTEGTECAKYCAQATNRQGWAHMDHATQGVVTLTISDGHAPDEFECNVIRANADQWFRN